jgi:hypothetical protein
VSHQDDVSDLSQSQSSVQRPPGQENEPQTPNAEVPAQKPDAAPPGALVSPGPGDNDPIKPVQGTSPDASPVSPIRPTVPDDAQPHDRLTPMPPGKSTPEVLTPREQMQRAEEALISLREKMAQVAAEFAEGKLNQAQFDAIYGRYSEQRIITERLLARNPESQAWQSVVRPGHTTFLKSYYEARVISYAIYDRETCEQIALTGSLQLQRVQIKAVLQRLQAIVQERGDPGPARKQIGGGRCVLFVPGKQTVAVAIYSLEPSVSQVKRAQDIHHDFERANQHALRRRDYAQDRLVFPHRALFEEKR